MSPFNGLCIKNISGKLSGPPVSHLSDSPQLPLGCCAPGLSVRPAAAMLTETFISADLMVCGASSPDSALHGLRHTWPPWPRSGKA